MKKEEAILLLAYTMAVFCVRKILQIILSVRNFVCLVGLQEKPVEPLDPVAVMCQAGGPQCSGSFTWAQTVSLSSARNMRFLLAQTTLRPCRYASTTLQSATSQEVWCSSERLPVVLVFTS
jgi:hypothetical protein